MVHRHNEARGLWLELARRAGVRPVLEKAGLLADPAQWLHLRRPADVLVHLPRGPAVAGAPQPPETVALDIKVIDALGPSHARAAALPAPQAAMSAFAARAGRLHDTARLCLANGIRYLPVVCTAQGGRSSATDAMVKRLALLVEAQEGTSAATVAAQFGQQVSRCLILQATRAFARGRGRVAPRAPAAPLARALLGAAARRPAAGAAEDDARSTTSGGGTCPRKPLVCGRRCHGRRGGPGRP